MTLTIALVCACVTVWCLWQAFTINRRRNRFIAALNRAVYPDDVRPGMFQSYRDPVLVAIMATTAVLIIGLVIVLL